MAKKKDPLNLGPHWHVDCRIESELPEDRAVGTRFLVNMLFGSLALVFSIFAGWLAYRSFTIRSGISYWQEQIEINRADVQDIRKIQQDYMVDSARIERVADLIGSPFLVSGMISSLGRARPESLLVDSVAWNESGIVVQGSGPSADRVNQYVDALRSDADLAGIFSGVRVSNYEQIRNQEGRFAFEITLSVGSVQ